ncbi:MAG: hypothetical protein NUV54_01065, partial [Candidatus Taylorbacteria bacterium]|nr:hypothetical protein [Candidatus Taylorbacteria bacterium]
NNFPFMTDSVFNNGAIGILKAQLSADPTAPSLSQNEDPLVSAPQWNWRKRSPDRDRTREENAKKSAATVYGKLRYPMQRVCDVVRENPQSTKEELAKILNITPTKLTGRLHKIYFVFGVFGKTELRQRLLTVSTPEPTRSDAMEVMDSISLEAPVRASDEAGERNSPVDDPEIQKSQLRTTGNRCEKVEDDDPFAVTQMAELVRAIECLRRGIACNFTIEYSPRVDSRGTVTGATVEIKART